MKYLQKIKGWGRPPLLLLLIALFAPWNANAQKVLPYSYGFENNDLTAEGWTKTTGGIIMDAAHEGSYGFRFYYSEGYLVSPLLTGTDDGIELTFYYTANSMSYGEGKFQIGYTTEESVTDPSGFTYGETVNVSSTSWIRYETSLPEGTKYVAVKRIAYYGDNIYIDDFSFAAPSSCPNPKNLQASLTGSNGSNATLSWTENGSAINWVLEYGTTSDFTGAISVNVSDTPTKEITNLRPLTTYYARVKADCGGGDQSVWSDICEFTMPAANLLVNDGNSYSSYVPFYGYYANYGAHSQFILPAESLEIMVGSTIDKLTFFSYSYVIWSGSVFNVYMTEVENDVFESAEFAEWSTMNQVYSGTLNISGNKMTISLNEPFFYQGNNLMIGFEEIQTGTSKSVSWYGVYGNDNTAVAGYKTSSTGNLQMLFVKFLPKMSFDYTESEYLRVASIEQGDITATTAQFSWIAPSSEVTGYEYQYWRSSETWPDEWISINATTVTINDLRPITEYKFRIRAVYGEHHSAPHTINFQTVCLEYADIPFFEDFNNCTNFVNFTTNNLPPCWSYINTSTSNFSGCPLVYYANSDDRFLFFNCSSYNSPQDQYAILPPMENLDELRIKFNARLNNISCPSSIIVGVMSDPTDAGTFVPISSTGDLTMTNKKFKVKLEDVTDNYNYIAFKMEAATTQQKQAIVDNVTVEPIPSCEDPDDLTVEAITGHTATFSWTDNGGSDAWQIYVATDNTLPEELVPENLHEVTTNPGTVSGLAPQTSYYAWVRGNCGDPVVYGVWSDPVSFTTGVACPQLINLTVSEVATTSATINWTSDGQETAWQVCVNNDEAHLVDVVNNTYTIPGLTPATTYTVKVRANCGGEDGYSDWSNPKYFTTEVACPEQIDFTVSDIASTYATLNWTSYGQETAWQICLNEDEAHLIDVTNNSYTFTNLTPATEYTVKMRANCGIVDGYSDWTYEQWFTTDFCDPEYKCNISYTANGFTGWDEATIAFMDDETEIAWLTMNEGSGELALCPGQYSIVWYGYCEGDGSFSIYGSDGNELLSITQCDELYYEQELGSFEHVCEGVCFPPKNLDVWARATSATMTWDQGGDEEQWKLSWSVDNSWTEPEIVNETNYDFDNLTPGATYKARVKAVCGLDNESGWKEITFITPLCDDACRIRYVLEDESDDGWDDNAHISVVRNSDNKEVAQLTVTANNSPLTGYLPLCPDETYSFIWVAGGEYDTECSFTIYGSDWTTIIVSHEAGDEINDGEVLCGSYEHTCEGCEIFEISYDTPYIEDFNNTCWNTWGTNDPPYYYCSPSLWGGANGMASVSPGCYTSSYISLRPVKVTPTTQLTFRAWVEVWLDELIGTSTVLVSTNNGHTWIPIGQAYEGGEIVSENDEVFQQVSTKTLSLGDYAQYDFILVGFRYQGFSDNNNQISTMFVDGIRIYDPNVFEGNAKSGLWSDANNWTQGVPSEGDYVLINGDCILDTDANLSSLKVNEGKSLTIQSGKTMITEQASTSNMDQLVIKDGGQFITNTTVLATIEKSVVGRDNGGKWNFIASPITDYQGINPANVNLMTVGDYDLYRFNQSPVLVDGIGKEWENYKAHSGEFKLFNGKGYLYSNKSDVTLSLTGDIHSGESASEGLVFAEENVNNDMSFRGWNLVGNPLTFNAYVNRSYYKMNDVGTAITAVSEYANPDNRIAPCTGIMVKAESDDDEFVIFSRGLPEGAYSNGSLNVALAHTDMRGASRGSAAFIDNAIISFNEGSKLTKFYFGDSEANIYIPQNNEELAVVCAEGMGEMPLNFKATENGSYTLGFNNEGVTFSYLHLIDNKTGSDVDLLVNPSYNFEALVTDYESRFKLVFVTNGASEDANESGFAFFSNGNWIISNEGEATLQVIDINGRVLSSETVNGSVSKAINAAPGIYILRLINGDSVKVQKVVVR